MIDLFPELSVPDCVCEAMESEAMKRIARIEMNCGCSYTSIPLFAQMEPYTRAQHSFNVSRLVYFFTGDPVQTFAGLFHDIAAPAFSHVIDFLNGDYLNQESTEDKTALMIEQDPLINEILSREHIPIEAVTDYHRYPIADNDSPQLSCDRLEYTLGNAVNYRFLKAEDANKLLHKLTVVKNESGIDELAFTEREAALRFADAALKCGMIYSGKQDRYAMEYLAQILKMAMKAGCLSADDLYSDEAVVISCLKNGGYEADWNRFCSLYDVVESDDAEGIAVNAKRRYIDPLIVGEGRVSAADERMNQRILQFLSDDYSILLKGLFYGQNDRNCQHK